MLEHLARRFVPIYRADALIQHRDVARLAVILRCARRSTGIDISQGLHKQLRAHVLESVEQLPGGLVFAYLRLCGIDNVPGVHLACEIHRRHAGYLIAVEHRPLYRGRSPVLRQDRSVDIHTAVFWQIKDLFGLTLTSNPSDFLEKWGVYFQSFDTIDPWCALIGVVSVVVIAITPKFSKKIPGSLIAIILMTVVALLLKQFAGVESIETIGDRFSISNELPAAQVPAMNWETIKSLVSPAITIAILGAIESLLSATVADGVISDHHDSNTELVAQGLANIASPLFGGIPATGAIARTMTNINNGGKTPIAGIIHAIVLLLIFLFLMPLAQYIPMACLAGVLVVVSYGMSGWRSFLALMKNPKSDVTVLLITFFLTIIFDLTVAIEVGLIIACLLFMKRMSETTDVTAITDDEIDLNKEFDFLSTNLEHYTIPKGVEVYEINGPFFFGAGNKFEEVMAAFGDRPLVRVIRMRKVPFVDSTGIHNLTNLCEMSQKEDIQVVLSGVCEKVNAQLEKAGFYNILGKDNITDHISKALKRAEEIIEKKTVNS